MKNINIVAARTTSDIGEAHLKKSIKPSPLRRAIMTPMGLPMTVALEPMFAEGKGAIESAEDEWTLVMRDGKRAAHFEHTILVTKDGPEVLTA